MEAPPYSPAILADQQGFGTPLPQALGPARFLLPHPVASHVWSALAARIGGRAFNGLSYSPANITAHQLPRRACVGPSPNPPAGWISPPLGRHHFAADQHRAPCRAAPCPGRPCSAMSVGRRPSSGQPPSPPRQRLSTHAASPATTTITVASREVASRQPASARWRRASRTCVVGVGVGLADLLVHVLLSLCPYSS